MTNAEAVSLLMNISAYDIDNKRGMQKQEALEMAIKALMQQLRDCKTCKHSDNGNCAGTEECHECMWESKYEQQPCEDCISRQAAIDALQGRK